MSSFRPGPVPPGVEVKRPVWPTLTPSQPAPVRPAQPKAAPAHQLAAYQAAGQRAAPDPTAELNAARMEAARILQEAAIEAEKAQEAAYRQGFEQGRAEGMAAGKAELELLQQQVQLELENARLQAANIRQGAEGQAAIARVEAEKEAQASIVAAREEAHRIVEAAREEAARRLDESQAALVELAVAAATRLVQGHLALHPQSIVQMVATGLRRLKDTQCTVRVHPEELPLLEAQRSTLERELGAGSLTLSGDGSLQRGSYLVHSPQGQIDGTLEHQAERLQAAMRAALGGNDA